MKVRQGTCVSWKQNLACVVGVSRRRGGRTDTNSSSFFDDNTYVLRKGDPLGERLGKVAREQNILLMLCDQCALERGLAEGVPGDCQPKDTVAGVRVGCFPDLYAALAGNPPDQVITL